MLEVASLTFSVAQTLIAAIDCFELKQLFSMFGYESQLVKLEQTVKAIQSVLHDASTKPELSEQEQYFIHRLTAALYDADDLVDELNTLNAQEMMQCGVAHDQESAGLFSKVHNFLNKWFFAYDMSREVNQLRERLDGIASDASKFCFKVDNQPIRQIREATCSYVYHGDIIGREEDTKRVVEILLDPNVEGHIPVLTIVGMGGLGKTALAQLVFEDDRIKKEFPLKLWACVSDEGQSQLNVDSVLGSILKSANTDETHIDNLVREQLQIKLREKLQGEKYLLVLDDVWTENHGEWLKLVGFLKAGLGASRIVVTTRSKGTAIAVGSNGKLIYELSGLSNVNSWSLFEAIVGQEQANRTDLVVIGRAIVENCANVPLAIKVIGSLLYGQEKSKWQSFQKNRLSEIQNGKNDVMNILKFSYHHLTPSLKSCFSFCAIFPKDSVIRREKLISLWMAQGYVEPLDVAQSIEDAAAENFMILVRRCFFQDVVKDEYGEIVSCKIHDLMHDLAQAVTKNEICITNPNLTAMSNLDAKIRHISVDSRNCTKSFFTKFKIRTYLHRNFWNTNERIQHFPISELLANLVCLRALDLSHLNLQSLPDTIGGLLHLRYLNLSYNKWLEVLPKSITKLHNLQTLILVRCSILRELPKDLSKLVELRVLDIDCCNALSDMPADMGKLTCLCKLPVFLVGGRNSRSEPVADIGELGPLNNLKGSLRIQIGKYYRSGMEKHREGSGYLSNKERLRYIHIDWPRYGCENDGSIEDQEALLEVMQPHHNLSVFRLEYYPGERIPRWGREDKFATCLPNLVEIVLSKCKGLQELPWMSKLRFLKTLKLFRLENVEYMENNSSTSNRTSYYGGEIESSSSSSSLSVVFFPSLEKLELYDLWKLRGWWRVGDDQVVVGNESNTPVLPPFPRLSTLKIYNCPELTSIPPCSNLETLYLGRVNVMLRIKEEEKLGGEVEVNVGDGSSSLAAAGDSRNQKHDGSKLRSVSGLEHLTALEQLSLNHLEKLSFNEDDMPWRSFGHNLRELELYELPKMEKLPKGMRHLTSLHSLTIDDCPKLEELPEWIGCLSSLQSLQIWKCPKMKSLPDAMRNLTSLTTLYIDGCHPILKRRCTSPDGEEWPKIQHIPTLILGHPLIKRVRKIIRRLRFRL